MANAPALLVETLAARGTAMTVLDTGPVLRGLAGRVSKPSCLIQFEPRAKLDPTAIRLMRRAIVERKPSVVHAFLPKATAASVLATMSTRVRPAIVSFRGITFTPTLKDPGNWVTVLHPRVKRHTCESLAVAESLVAARIAPEACDVVYNCVKLERTASVECRALRSRFGIPQDAFVIGTVATIRPVKGIDVLLRAAAECADLRDTWWLVAGPIRHPLVRTLAADPRVAERLRLVGPVGDGHALGGAMDLFVMPSRREALCRGLLEAMSRGACPICSDAGGMKELVRHDQDGIIFPREDVAALVHAIRDLHSRRDRVHEMANSAVDRVNTLCSPDAMADRVTLAHTRAAT